MAPAMLALAVSFLALTAMRADTVQPDLSPKEMEVWQRLQKGFVTLDIGGIPSGAAALIDSSGLYLAHQSGGLGPPSEAAPVAGTLSNGKTLRFVVIAQDSLTKLILLQAQNWKPEYGSPVRMPEGDETGHGMVFAVVNSGPIRAAFTRLNFPGFVQAEKRVIPLNEVQFESPPGGCAGALLVDEDGELLGVLNATLSKGDVVEAPVVPLAGRNAEPRIGGPYSGGGGFGGGGASGSLGGILRGRSQMGPLDRTVAYTAGVVVLRKVVDGFRSPSHHVAYPSIGLLCKDTPRGGALVQAVQPMSPADLAGIRTGDILASIAGVPIRNQVDFALVMLNQTAGDSIVIEFRRRTRLLVESVTVGHS